ncbi:MAG: hypothetical protein HKO90_07745 [Flavobacteriaceae bacterium]|nr:hypothetical protein [Bacteroidia bacterium]NNK88162.1 hypothetical protein [Flavobacteriaceae bacterium]
MSLISCKSDDDNSGNSNCENQAIISAFQYSNATSDIFSLDSIEIAGDCVIATISASGCDGESWDFRLVDSDAIMESFPPQRNLRLILSNNEACLAFLSREFSFDITNLQVEGNTVILNIDNTNESLSYTY